MYERVGVGVRVLEQRKGEGEGEEGMGDLETREEDNVEGEEVQAQTYVWKAGEQLLESKEWDFEVFVREKMGRWVGGEGREGEDEGFRG